MKKESCCRVELMPINRLTMGFMTNPLIGQSSYRGMDSLLIVCSGGGSFLRRIDSVYCGRFHSISDLRERKTFKRGEIKNSAYEYLIKVQRGRMGKLCL